MVLTQKDFDQIEQLIDEKLEEKLKYLPTKDEFFTAMDKVMKELETIRGEMVISSGQLSDHENRIEKIEAIHPHGQHSFPAPNT